MKRRFAGVLIGGLLSISLAATAADAPKKVRPEVGKPLIAAQTALQAKDYAEAQAKLDVASHVENLTPFESYSIARLQTSLAQDTHDDALALSSYKALLASPELPAAEKVQVLNAVARFAYTTKDYATAAQYAREYREAGGTDAQMSLILAQALYLSDDFAGAQKELLAQFAQMEQAGQVPPELQIKLYLSCAVKQSDDASYRAALQKLVMYYPKANYWQELITRTIAQPGFNNRYLLDMYRLKAATGTIDNADEYADAAQLALTAGLPGEAQQYVDQGYAKGLLGSGDSAAKDQMLKKKVAAKMSEDKGTLAEGERVSAAQAGGDALVATGMNYVGYGQYDKGIDLIKQGIAKGKLKDPDAARLRLGYAQFQSGALADAQESFKSVAGSEGGQRLAQLWLLVKQAP